LLRAFIFGLFIDQSWSYSASPCLPAAFNWTGVRCCLPRFWPWSLHPSWSLFHWSHWSHSRKMKGSRQPSFVP